MRPEGLKMLTPPPLYLRASIFLSQGVDPALLLTPMGVACIFATCMTENRVCKNREWKIGSLGQSPLIKTNSDILHPQLYGDMDYINCGAKIVDQKLRCRFKAQFASFSLQTLASSFALTLYNHNELWNTIEKICNDPWLPCCLCIFHKSWASAKRTW